MLQPFPQADGRTPAHLADGGRIHQLARRTVGLGGVEEHLTRETHDLLDQHCHLGDGDVRAETDVHMGEHRLGMLLIHRGWQLHEEDTGGGQVVDMEEFPPGAAGAP